MAYFHSLAYLMNFDDGLRGKSFLKRQLVVPEKSFLDMSRLILIFGGMKGSKFVHIVL